MFNPFSWLRTAAYNATLGGVVDALQELHAAAGDQDRPVTLADLQVRLQLAAPPSPPAEEEEGEPTPAKKKR